MLSHTTAHTTGEAARRDAIGDDDRLGPKMEPKSIGVDAGGVNAHSAAVHRLSTDLYTTYAQTYSQTD
jgi:hypothetical protein